MRTKYLYFTETDLPERWAEIKEDFWGDLKTETLRLVKRLMENCLNDELNLVVKAPYYAHNPETRNDYRNGYYERSLETNIGFVNEIKVPRARNTTFKTRVFDKYQRRQKEVNTTLMKMFLKGVSTREVGNVIEPLLGVTYSASTISNITKTLDAEVKTFHSKKLEDKYSYLFLDGITVKIKNCLKSEKMLVLAAYGITKEGFKELIAFKISNRENEANWTIFINDMYNRGLTGSNLKLIITDGQKGLLAALDVVYPNVPRQRCWVHKLRNVASKLPKNLHSTCLAESKLIYQAKNKRQAIKIFRKWKSKWNKKAEKAVKCIENDLDDLLRFFDSPEAHWKKIRTTNAIERNFREVRRRIRTMNVFTNHNSCDRIIFAVFNAMNNKWEKHPLKGFNQ